MIVKVKDYNPNWPIKFHKDIYKEKAKAFHNGYSSIAPLSENEMYYFLASQNILVS